MPDLNFLAIGVCTIGAFMLGGLWYSPLLFAKKWVALHGYSQEQVKEMQKSATPSYLVAIISTFVSAVVMAIFISRLGITEPLKGAGLGVLAWVGFAGATGLTNTLFSAKPMGLFVIDGLYQFIYFAAFGAVFAVWR